MKRMPVESTTLRSVGYSKKNKILQLEFSSREVYDYYEVPDYVYMGLMKADSHGSYFNQEIKDHYNFTRLLNGH